MTGFNSITLMGSLVKDPAIRDVQAGTHRVCDMTMAVREYNKGHENTICIDVEVWDKIADRCMMHARKGDPIFVSGVLKHGAKKDKNGKRVNTFFVSANTVRFMARWYPSSDGAQEMESTDEEFNGSVKEIVGDWSPVSPDSPTSPKLTGGGSDDEFPF